MEILAEETRHGWLLTIPPPTRYAVKDSLKATVRFEVDIAVRGNTTASCSYWLANLVWTCHSKELRKGCCAFYATSEVGRLSLPSL